jgi:hypothetical protein
MLTFLPEIHFLLPLPSLGQPEVGSIALHLLPALCKDLLGSDIISLPPYLVYIYFKT